ncbi:MAG: O-antigen ligase family protein [Candidatus Promineifilaceae bacterium]
MIERMLASGRNGALGWPFNIPLWLWLLLVPGLLAFSLALGLEANSNQMKMVLGLLLAAGAVVVLARWPPLGLVLAPLAGMVTPSFGMAGLNAVILLIGLLAGLWLLDMLVRQRSLRLVSAVSVQRPALIWLAVVCLAFIVGQLPWFSFARNAPLDAQLGGFAIFALAIAAFLLAANQIKSLRWLQAMVWAFLAFGAVYILGRVLPPLSPLTNQLFQRQSIGPLFWAWLPALALSQAAFNRDLSRRWRMALAALTVAALYSAFVQNFGWKSGWVTAGAAVAGVVAARSWRAGLLLALVGVPFALGTGQGVLASEDYSVSTRFEAWLILLEILKVSPVLGLGFANYYWYTPLFAIRGWYVRFNSHNNYVDIVAQTGLIGLLCFFWLFWEVGRLGWSLRQRAPAGFARAYVYGALGGLVGTLVAAGLGDWVLPFVYNIGMNGFKTGVAGWLFLGGLVALGELCKGQEQASEVRAGA